MVGMGMIKPDDVQPGLPGFTFRALVVCGRNKRRSRTAEYIFKNDQRFSMCSVGLSPASERQIKEKDIEWADLILVMEREQASRIRKTCSSDKRQARDLLSTAS